MDFGMEAGIFLIYTACLMLIYFFGKWLLIPLKIILKVLVNSVLGGVALVILHLLCNNFEIFLPVNIITAVIAGLLGIPGVIGILIFFNV